MKATNHIVNEKWYEDKIGGRRQKVFFALIYLQNIQKKMAPTTADIKDATFNKEICKVESFHTDSKIEVTTEITKIS